MQSLCFEPDCRRRRSDPKHPLGEQHGHDSPRVAGIGQRVLFHPDYTVGSGISPDLLTFRRKPEALAGCGHAPDTAGGELHPALRTA